MRNLQMCDPMYGKNFIVWPGQCAISFGAMMPMRSLKMCVMLGKRNRNSYACDAKNIVNVGIRSHMSGMQNLLRALCAPSAH